MDKRRPLSSSSNLIRFSLETIYEDFYLYLPAQHSSQHLLIFFFFWFPTSGKRCDSEFTSLLLLYMFSGLSSRRNSDGAFPVDFRAPETDDELREAVAVGVI